MYSVLLSKIEKGIDLTKDFLKDKIDSNSKVAVFPWAFPLELDSDKLVNEYFKKGEKKYNKYINSLKEIGIKEENITICNCYSDSSSKLKKIIENSNVLLFPGGNPEMLFNKVVHGTEILYDIKYFKGIIIGESAGCELHLKRYFITAKNNYYSYFAFYDGFGIMDDPFYMDVHSIKNKLYLDKLQRISNEKKKNVYAIFDDGALVYNRSNDNLEIFGNVIKFSPENKI